MNKIVKYAMTATIAVALGLASAAPSQARHGRKAAVIGFGAGALVGAAAASAAYNRGYDYAPGYYAYAPGPYEGYDAYGYAPSYRYYDYGWRWSDEHSTNNFSIDSQR